MFIHGALVYVFRFLPFSSFLEDVQETGVNALTLQEKIQQMLLSFNKRIILIDELPEIISIGIDSLKVEGG